MQVVWQKDGAWFPAGGTDYLKDEDVPEVALPALVLWRPVEAS
jgi:hypothetical protein